MRGFSSTRPSASPIAGSTPTVPSAVSSGDGVRPHILTKLMVAISGRRRRDFPGEGKNPNRDLTPIPFYPF
jgi:hypothetical protein